MESFDFRKNIRISFERARDLARTIEDAVVLVRHKAGEEYSAIPYTGMADLGAAGVEADEVVAVIRPTTRNGELTTLADLEIRLIEASLEGALRLLEGLEGALAGALTGVLWN